MKTIHYKTEDNSINISVEYRIGNPYRYYKGIGKSWPKTTQCLIYVNGFLKGSGEVVKHNTDPDNPKYAIKYATKKAMSCINLKYIRTALWKQIDEQLKQNEL